MQMKKELDSRIAANTHIHSMFTAKVYNLEKQLDTSTSKMRDLDKHLKHVRKREAIEKQQLAKVKNEIGQQKRKYDDLVNTLQRANKDLENSLRQTSNQKNTEITNLTYQYNDLEKVCNWGMGMEASEPNKFGICL